MLKPINSTKKKERKEKNTENDRENRHLRVYECSYECVCVSSNKFIYLCDKHSKREKETPFNRISNPYSRVNILFFLSVSIFFFSSLFTIRCFCAVDDVLLFLFVPITDKIKKFLCMNYNSD